MSQYCLKKMHWKLHGPGDLTSFMKLREVVTTYLVTSLVRWESTRERNLRLRLIPSFLKEKETFVIEVVKPINDYLNQR